MTKLTNRSKGFSLIEMLLTVVVFSGILMFTFHVLQSYAERTLARSMATYMEQIHIAVEEILDDPNNFTTIYSAVNARPNRLAEIALSDLLSGTGIIPVSANNLNANFSNTTPWKTGFHIILRASDDPFIVDDIPALDLILITDDIASSRLVNMAAISSEGNGGFFRGTDTHISSGGTPFVESAFASWSFPISNLDGSTWATNYTAAAVMPSLENGTYYVLFDHYNFNDIAGDYLYRTEVADGPDLNIMHTPLDMGRHNILGVDDLDSQTLTVEKNAVVNGQMRIDGNAVISAGNFTAGNTFTTGNATIRGEGTGVRGNFINQGVIHSDRSYFGDSVTATNVVFANGLNVTSDITAETINNINGTASFDDIYATQLVSTGALPFLQTYSFNTSKIETGHLDMDSSRQTVELGVVDFVVNGHLDNNGIISSDNLFLGTLSADVFGECDRGC